MRPPVNRAAFFWCARHAEQRYELGLDNWRAKTDREVTRGCGSGGRPTALGYLARR